MSTVWVIARSWQATNFCQADPILKSSHPLFGDGTNTARAVDIAIDITADACVTRPDPVRENEWTMMVAADGLLSGSTS